jgi:8-oxo-dGTP diphosphatase
MEIDKLALIFIKDKKLLATVSKGKDAFYMPGGKREPGETDQQALIREIREEISVDLLPKTIKFFAVYRAQAHGKPEGTFAKLTCFTGDFEGELAPASEIDKIIWVDSSDMEKATEVGKIILSDLLQKKLIG